MLEIEFRGRSTHNGEWHYGWLTYSKFHDAYEITDGNGVYNFVDPKTVGPYTGLKDKNGKKIFKSDIVKQTMKVNGEIIKRLAKIIFEDGSYWLSYSNSQIFKLSQNTIDIYELEIIGNISDNPELMNNKRGENG